MSVVHFVKMKFQSRGLTLIEQFLERTLKEKKLKLKMDLNWPDSVNKKCELRRVDLLDLDCVRMSIWMSKKRKYVH